MARSYEYAVIRLAPDQMRGERLNIGVAVFSAEDIDVRASRRMEKVRALSAAVDAEMVRSLLSGLQDVDRRLRDAGASDTPSRVTMLGKVGALELSGLGTFVAADHNEYETRVASIMRSMIDPEPAPARVKEKRSRLLTQMKKALRTERVLARPGEDLSSHRLVSSIEMDEGLVADLVLKNGAMHVVETVDATGAAETPRKALGDIGISALVLERARMKYGDAGTKTRLVYAASASIERIALPSLEAAHNQGATLTNWASADDRRKLIHELASLADPIPKKRKPPSKAQLDQFAFRGV